VGGALGMMLAWAPFRRTVLAAGLVVAVLAVAGGNPLGDTEQTRLLSERLASIGYSAEGVDPRFRVWKTTPEIIADHPLFGIGENAFSRIAPRYNLLYANSQNTFLHAHNIALTITAELGLFGLAALAWFVVALVGVLIQGYRRSPPGQRGILLALAAALVAVAVQGLVDYTLRSSVLVGVIFVLAGCAVVLLGHQRPETSTQRDAASA
jgi:O-antigen ligase